MNFRLRQERVDTNTHASVSVCNDADSRKTTNVTSTMLLLSVWCFKCASKGEKKHKTKQNTATSLISEDAQSYNARVERFETTIYYEPQIADDTK